MTHSLHRMGNPESLQDDYCLMCLPQRGVNSDDAPAKAKQFLDIVKRYNPANYGVITCGNMHAMDEASIVKGLETSPAIFCVLTTKEATENCLADLKKADIGLSVVVTAVYEMVVEACNKAGLSTHTVNHSLGIWGKTEKLPPREILEITTMCGHAQVSKSLVSKVLDDLEQQRLTLREAAVTLTKPCVCGFFNPVRAERLLEKALS